MKQWIALSAAIATEVSASLSLSAAQDNPRFFVIVVLGYIAAFIGLSLVMRWGMQLAVAYGIWGSAGVALTAMLGALIFRDPLSATMIIGILLIMAGVALVEFGRQHDTEPQPATRVS